MEVLEDIQVIRIVEPKLLGVHQNKNVYLYTGKFGEYLKHDGYNYSIPEWAKKQNLNVMFNLYHAIKIIDWKIKQKIDREETRPEERKTKCSNAKNDREETGSKRYTFLEDNE